MLTVATFFKLLAEIVLLVLPGPWMVGVLAAVCRAGNPVYRVVQRVCWLWIRAARWVSPRVFADRRLPWDAVLLSVLAWIVAAFDKVATRLQIGVVLCR